MSIKLFLAAATAATMFAAPALAQDNPGLQVYGGALLGLDHVVLKANGASAGKDGFAYGGVVGIDSSVGANTRLGVEAEVMGATTSEGYYLDAANNGSLDAGRDLYIGVRAGVYAAPQLLAYVKGGYTNARFNLNVVDQGNAYNFGSNLDGYRLGVGAEYGNKVRLRLEYRFSHYGNAHYQGADLGIHAERHQVLAGLLYGF
ncbi:MAG: porin family protein [Sphingomonadales bacterium]|nr:porin family protein [Sphingomonadales bacterium]